MAVLTTIDQAFFIGIPFCRLNTSHYTNKPSKFRRFFTDFRKTGPEKNPNTDDARLNAFIRCLAERLKTKILAPVAAVSWLFSNSR